MKSSSLSKESLQEFMDAVEAGTIKVNIDQVFTLDTVSEAHQYMEDNKAKRKVLVKL